MSFRQCGARDFLVVEVKRLTPDDLVVLMPLPGNQHEVAGSRFRDRLVNSLRAISDLAIRLARPLNPLFRIAEYLLGIFRARVVGRENHNVTQATRRLTHRCSFRPVREGPPTSMVSEIRAGLSYLGQNRLLRTMALVVGPTRPDGKHEVATVLQRLALCDNCGWPPHTPYSVEAWRAEWEGKTDAWRRLRAN